MLNDLLLLSGNDIPFEQAQISIHQPTIKEIAYIGEENFFTGCEFLRFSKDKLNEEDRISLEKHSNFEILMSIMREQKNVIVQKNKVCAIMLLTLLFPDYKIEIQQPDCIALLDIQNKNAFYINKDNFEDFKVILDTMFCFNEDENSTSYNPNGDMAAKIAEKLRKRHQRIADENEGQNKVAILSRYISILSVGQQKDMNTLLQYTVYQLFDEFKRYELKVNFDINLQARMAGAKDLQEVDDWMKDIHP